MLYVMLMEYTNCLILSQKRKLIEYYYQFCYILLYTLARKENWKRLKVVYSYQFFNLEIVSFRDSFGWLEIKRKIP